MVDSILKIVAAGLGMLAVWYVGKQLLKVMQARQNGLDTTLVTDATKQVQEDTQTANLESDKLKAIEGR